MKIIFLSDIHGNNYALSSFLVEMKQLKPDKIVFCGDIFGYYYYQNEIIDIFRNNDYVVLLGNHDQYFIDIVDRIVDEDLLISKYGNSYRNIESKITDENIQFIKSLNPSYKLDVNGCNIGVFHGSPLNPLEGRIYPDTIINEPELYEKYDYVILGHTHHKMDRKVGNTTLLNPGSIGQQRDGKGCSYLILDTNTGIYEYKIINYPISDLIKDIDKYDNGNFKLKEVLLRKRF